MTSETGLRHMTAEELLQHCDEPYHQELVAGTLHETEPPGAEHGIVAMRVGTILSSHVAAAGLGVAFAAETGFRLARDPDTARAPDAARRTATGYRARGGAAGDALDIGDVVPGWSPRVAEFFV